MTTESNRSLLELLQAVHQQVEREEDLPIDVQRHVILHISNVLQACAKTTTHHSPLTDMQDVRGQDHVKRVLEVAAAGGHAVLLLGARGAGKKFLARTLPTLLPIAPELYPLRIAPAGMNLAAFVGSEHRPGEVTLAHHGVLLLEQLAAFDLPHLHAVRQAMERREIHPQGNEAITFPAHFLLVATVEPCPCGFYSDVTHECTCSVQDIKTFQRRIRETLTSCFDLHIDVARMDANVLMNKRRVESSATIRERVEVARARQRRRYVGTPYHVNADLVSLDEVQHGGVMTPAAEKMLKAALQHLHLSVRDVVRTLSVARTSADLGESEVIEANHLAEALQYRPRTADNWMMF